MKFTVPASSLLDAVTFVAAALANRPTYPIMAGALIQATPEGVYLSSSDYDNALRAEARNAEVTETGSVLVPGKVLAAITGKLKGPIHVEQAGAGVKLTAAGNTYTLASLPVEEYPDLSKWFEVDASATIDAGMLAQTYAKVHYAHSSDSTLPALTAVRLTSQDHDLAMACTDRYQMAIATARFTKPSEFTEALVPAKLFQAIVKGLHGQVSFGTTPTLLTLADATKTASVRLLDAQFPKLDSLFEQHGNVTWKAKFKVDALTEAIDRLQALDTGKTVEHPVRLTITADQIRITTHGDVDNQGAEHIACELETKLELPIDIQMNPTYLRQGINAHNLMDVWIGSSKPPVAPVIIGGYPTLKAMMMPQRPTG